MRLDDKTASAGRSRRREFLPAALALTVAAGLLAGCQSSADPLVTAGIPTDGYRTKYPIVVAEGEETMDIPVGVGFAGLSAQTRANVRAFAADAGQRATSSLVILAPSGSRNQAAAAAAAREARNEALAAGLSPGLVQVRGYAVGDGGVSAPIRLSYSRIKAMSPPCGQWTEQLLAGRDNDEGAEFGCATQANFAAMVSNPEDLITPRVETTATASRRLVIWRKWLDGQPTSTLQPLDSATTTGGE